MGTAVCSHRFNLGSPIKSKSSDAKLFGWKMIRLPFGASVGPFSAAFTVNFKEETSPETSKSPLKIHRLEDKICVEMVFFVVIY